MSRIVDLSMPVHADMLTFPRVPPPALLPCTRPTSSSPSGSAPRSTGVDMLHRALPRRPGRPRGHPLRRAQAHRPRRRRAGDDPARVLRRRTACCSTSPRPRRATASAPRRSRPSSTASTTQVKERDIVLIHTGAGAYNHEERYKTDHCGMTAEATRWLIERGVRMMGIDAITFDPPVWAMFERKQFWEAHRVMWDEEYWHLENLMNLEQIGRPHGFQLVRAPGQVGGHDGRAGARRRDRGGRVTLLRFADEHCQRSRGRGRQGRLAGAHDGLGLPVPPGFVVPRRRPRRGAGDRRRRSALLAAPTRRGPRGGRGGAGARPGGRLPAAARRRGSPRLRASSARTTPPVAVRSSATRRGLRGGELRRPAGDLPARARRRRGASSASATAGRRSSPSGRSSTASRRARSTTSAWRSSCSAW